MTYWQTTPTRRQMEAFLAPIREALKELRTGEVMAERGYPVARDWQGEWVRIDWAMNGFIAMTRRACPQLDLSGFERIANKLEAGTPLTVAEIDQALGQLRQVGKALCQVKRGDLKGHVLTEQIDIEIGALGLREAA